MNEILRRHDVLRSTINLVDDEPVQQIVPSVVLALEPIDLCDQPLSERKASLQSILKQEATRPFDLSKGPLIRAELLRTDSEEHILLLTMHHAAFDGRSEEILLDELALTFDAISNGNPLPGPLPFQYADFVSWQRRRVGGDGSAPGDRFEERLGYWTERLRGLSDLNPRWARRRSHDGERAGSCLCFEVDGRLTSELRAVGHTVDATLFMTLLAAFKILLCRYSRTHDLAVGTPVAGRVRPEFDELIGCFTNTLVLRTDLSGKPSFREFLEQVRAVALDAFDHQEIPFEYVVRSLGLNPEQRRTAVPVLFQLRNYQSRSINSHWLSIEPIDFDFGITPTDLVLDMKETGKGLVGKFLFDSNLFEAATISRMADHFQRLLRSIATDPQCPIDRLEIFGRQEIEVLTRDWSRTAVPIETAAVPELIARQAHETPDATAISIDGCETSYSYLLERADALAEKLRKYGVGRESRVGIVMRRTPEMIIGAVAVLRAGGTFVPIDPAYPKERITFMLEDSRPDVVLVDSQQDLAAPIGATLLPTSRWPAVASSPAKPASPAPTDAAYITYTSGSTGQPKGVVVEHRSLSNLTQWGVSFYGVTPSDRLLQFTSISFDPFIEDLVLSLTCGACLVLRTDRMTNDAATFFKACATERITILNLPTAFWHELVPFLDRHPFPGSVHTVILGGEAAHPQMLSLWHDHMSDRIRLVNEYGPTETTVVATRFDCSSLRGKSIEVVPIGTPIDNTRTYVLGHGLQPVPVGVPGELYLGGLGLARGYLNRTDLTRQRFLPDPFDEDPEARIYKTGDLVRWHPDGYLEFLGRVDRQIKLRGYRIELEEIEAVISGLDTVREASVILVSRDDEDFLAAFVVREEHPSPALDIRAELEDRLPGFMIPSIITDLDALPRLPNGKVDRSGLPQPSYAPAISTRPLTETEQRLAAIWIELLGVESVAPDSGFFELGGHSLLAMRLIARIADVFDVNLTLGSLFAGQNLHEVAKSIDSRLEMEGSSLDGDLAQLLDDIEGLPDEEAARLLRSN